MISDENLETIDRLMQGGAILLLSLSLLAFGSVRGWGHTLIILLAAFVVLCWGCRMAARGEICWVLTPLDKAVAAFAILYVIQVVVGFPWGWKGVNPDGMMSRAMDAAGRLPFFPGTLDYHATRDAFILFLAYAGVFYCVVHTVRTRRDMDRLVLGLSGLTMLVAFYGLVEFLSGNHGIFGWKEYAPDRVRGTLVNPDHFAAYLGMVIPLVIAYLIGSGAGRSFRRRRSRLAEKSSEGGAPDAQLEHDPEAPSFSLFDRDQARGPWERESRQLVLGFGCALLIVALVFTFSRAGIVSFLTGSLFFVVLLWIREPGHRRRLAAIGALLAALAIIIWIGAEPVLERFGGLERDSVVRTSLYRDTLSMARDYPILGSGLGTFDRVFQQYAPPEFTFTTHVSHAHSEPLQLAAEGGLVAVLIVLFGFAALFRDLLLRGLLGLFPSGSQFALRNSKTSDSANPQSAIRDPKFEIDSSRFTDSPFHRFSDSQETIRNSQFDLQNCKFFRVRHDPYNIALGFGCLSSVIVILVHSCFDFPLRIPANGVLLSAILGMAVVAVGIRFRGEGSETLLPTRVFRLSRRSQIALALGAGGLALFMGWTAIAGALAERLGNRGEAIMAGTTALGGRGDKPWMVETERNREALESLQLAVRLDPLDADGQYRLGRLHEQLALRAWNAGLSVEGRFIADMPGRARVALEVLDEAMRQYARAIRLAPPYAEAWGRLGWAYGIRDQIVPFAPDQPSRAHADTDLALAGMRQAIALNPNNRYRHEVMAAFGFGRLEVLHRAGGAGQPLEDPIVRKGIRAQRRAIELDPAYLPEALTRMLRYSDDPAVLILAMPAQAPDMLFAARLLEEQELWPQAKGMFRKAIELAPDDGKPLYYREYAEALTRRGEDAEARDILKLVLRFDPQNLDLQLALAGSLHRLKQDKEALEVYQGAVELANAMAQDSRPVLASPARTPMPPSRLSRDQRVLEAVQNRFPVPQRTAGPMSKTLGTLAAFYHDQRRDDMAVPLWEKAIAAAPDDAATAFGLARSYDAVGAWISAVDYYKRAIELNRGNLEYRLTLADRYYDNDMTFQAINLWREVVAVRPTLVQTRLRLAGAYVRLEQYPDALREYERVLQLEPGNQAAKEGLIRLRGRASVPSTSTW